MVNLRVLEFRSKMGPGGVGKLSSELRGFIHTAQHQVPSSKDELCTGVHNLPELCQQTACRRQPKLLRGTEPAPSSLSRPAGDRLATAHHLLCHGGQQLGGAVLQRGVPPHDGGQAGGRLRCGSCPLALSSPETVQKPEKAPSALKESITLSLRNCGTNLVDLKKGAIFAFFVFF